MCLIVTTRLEALIQRTRSNKVELVDVMTSGVFRDTPSVLLLQLLKAQIYVVKQLLPNIGRGCVCSIVRRSIFISWHKSKHSVHAIVTVTPYTCCDSCELKSACGDAKGDLLHFVQPEEGPCRIASAQHKVTVKSLAIFFCRYE